MRRIRNQAVALAALAVLASCSNDDSPSRTEPSLKGAGSTSTLQPETGRGIQDRLASDNPRGLLDPGTYAVDVDGLRPPPVVELPKGFRFDTSPEVATFTRFGIPDCTLSALACRRTRYEPSGPGGRLKVGFWNGDQIMFGPDRLCGGGLEGFKHPGPSVEDLATALADLPGFRASDPVPVSLGGYDGLYVELFTVPPTCELFWTTDANPERGPTPSLVDDSVRGHVERLWVLEVGGGRIVVEASHEPGATGEQVAELTRIVESVTFEHTG